VQSFIVIGEGVWILWVVKVWPFPLDCDVAVNTGGRPSTCDNYCRQLISEVCHVLLSGCGI